ncbi:hypothetical protein CLOSTMETH_01748 [[Clostridium] methylpentosum DSM 5476]|uniref:Phage protein XkdS n=1 Tax=[Clostridium] methylpentosum DSM 5476 TaxID=537013 RepID=C0ED27_9FIRM|nr:hypothetical protein CLOSTMETH_01748 [[Clostridium] methylpentosum DSM 5476]MDY3990171.1 DUF2634 domain-containing protein [Massilioclostridium sp.]MEE1493049.1 DUF2634 domain-containing protein [Massilioclostridium sp.]
MPEIFPVFDVPEIPAQEVGTQRYYESMLFDFNIGDFVRDGSNKVVRCDGKTAWLQWCVKTVLTQRFSCLAYNSDIGTELEEAFAETDRQAAQSSLERTITEALLADPAGRTQCVKNFSFAWGADHVDVSFEVTGVEGSTEQLSIELKGG